MSPRAVAALLALALSVGAFAADAPFLKPNDVIALVGGEDMTALGESGYLESLLTAALPAHKLHFRTLAWEGDTVFEQRRDLNYPTLEQQLDKIGATVVIAQFGQMESLAGKANLPAFVAAYEKLFDRLSSGSKRRIVLVEPIGFKEIATAPPHLSQVESTGYGDAIAALAKRRAAPFISPRERPLVTRDWVHLAPDSLLILAQVIAGTLSDRDDKVVIASQERAVDQQEQLRQLIIAKNRFWFHYTRPQNWAFLAGDRTSQPSSRDHRDPNKRWFPEELEQFLPLIEKKEAEIWKLAAQLDKP